MERIVTSPDGRALVLAGSGETFSPWGFNFDRDRRMRMIEEFWVEEWDRVVRTLEYMRSRGGNVVRVHLQFQEFMQSPTETNGRNLEQLVRLAELAERVGIRLDVTGLAAYRNRQPAWYGDLDEEPRWEAQAAFWQAVAGAVAHSPAVAWFDLINEPVIGHDPNTSYVVPMELEGLFYVSCVSRDAGSRAATDVAVQWIRRMKSAIRSVDATRLITVGMLPSTTFEAGLESGFEPQPVATELDLLCAHIYPKSGEIDRAVTETARWAAAGRPVVVEETFALHCSPAELEEFIDASRPHACGWISFCWGDPRDDGVEGGEGAIIDLFDRRRPDAATTPAAR